MLKGLDAWIISSVFFFLSFFLFPLWVHQPSAAGSLLGQSLIIFSTFWPYLLASPRWRRTRRVRLLIMGVWAWVGDRAFFLSQWTPLQPLSAYPTIQSPRAAGMTLLLLDQSIPPSIPPPFKILRSLTFMLRIKSHTVP